MQTQTIFTQAIQHIVRQGWGSVDRFGQAYRGQDGNKCIVGYFIPDHKYHPDIEGLPLQALKVDLAIADEYSHHRSQLLLLTRLNALHDKCFNRPRPKQGSLVEYHHMRKFAKGCHKLAQRYRLIAPQCLTQLYDGDVETYRPVFSEAA